MAQLLIIYHPEISSVSVCLVVMFSICSHLNVLMWPHIISCVDDTCRESLSMGRSKVDRSWESDVGTVAGTSACGFCPSKWGSRVRGRGCSTRGRVKGYLERPITGEMLTESGKLYSYPWFPWGIGSRTPSDTKVHGCSSPLCKVA